MGQFRTSSLFHYTKSIDTLFGILLDGLIPNYCYEDLSYNNNDRGIGLPMISFCDIPLSKTNLFVERYGKYAIGLTKEWAADKRINPILYAKDENILISLSFYKSIEMHYEEELKKSGGHKGQITIELSPGPKPQIVNFINRINAHSANESIYGMVKKYYGEYEGQKQINYEENEWRYLIEDDDNTPWFWDKSTYLQWRGDKNTIKPEPTDALKEKRLLFTPSNIAFIIVSAESEISYMINQISKMKTLAGIEISEDEKLLLYTKIISIERIRRDF